MLELQIEITNRCNERCVHCYIPHEVKNAVLDEKTFCNILNDAKNLNVLSLVLSGGEPMLHPNFCQFLKKAKDLDFSVSVMSNLTVLTNEIVKILKEGTTTTVNVSVYSMNPAIHEAITRLSGSLEKTLKNIDILLENNVPVQINLPVMRQNVDCFGDVIEWGERKGLTVRSDYELFACNDCSVKNLEARIDKNDLKKVMLTLYNRNSYIKSQFKSAHLDEILKKPKDIENEFLCGAGSLALAIDAFGNVKPCAVSCKNIGNIREKSLKEIWESSPEIEYLRGLKRKDLPKCLTCEDRNFCAFCMARNANESGGDIFALKPFFCELAKVNRQVAIDLKNEEKI